MGTRWTQALALFVMLGAHGPLFAEETRPLPDYDGRPEPTTAADVALWVPRVLFYPIYLVSDFVVRRPLGFAATTAERDLSGGKGGLPIYFMPTFLYERGMQPSLGIHLWSDRFFAEDNTLRGRAAFWGLDVLSFAILDRLQRGPLLFSASVDWSSRSDSVFFGIGPSSRDTDRSRFHARRFDATLGAAFNLAPQVTTAVRAGFRDVAFEDGACCDDPSLADQIVAGVFGTPHGFDSGVRAFLQRLELTMDSRVPGAAPRVGARFAAEVEHGSELRSSSDDWLRYGGTLEGFVDLTSRARVLDLTVSVRFVRPLSGAVPFTELVSLGGADMAGFLEGRLLGDSATTARLRYQWPVWVFLRGSLTAEVGNVFGPDLEGFDVERMRMSFTMGLRSFGRDFGLQALVGVGTEPFDEGARVSSVRVAIGGFSEF